MRDFLTLCTEHPVTMGVMLAVAVLILVAGGVLVYSVGKVSEIDL